MNHTVRDRIKTANRKSAATGQKNVFKDPKCNKLECTFSVFFLASIDRSNVHTGKNKQTELKTIYLYM